MEKLIKMTKIYKVQMNSKGMPNFSTAVEVADRPQGEWIKRHGTINCSVCKRSNWSACFEDTVRSFNFCPSCGAKMKGADDEDN